MLRMPTAREARTVHHRPGCDDAAETQTVYVSAQTSKGRIYVASKF